MSNRLVVETNKLSDGRTIVLFSDDYASSYLLFENDMPEWDEVWYKIFESDGFDDLSTEFQVNDETRTVIVDDDGYPVQKEGDRFGVPTIEIW